MLLNQYHEAMEGMRRNKNFSFKTPAQGSSYFGYSSSSFYDNYAYFLSIARFLTSSSCKATLSLSTRGIVFGEDNTEEDGNSHKLISPITSGLSFSEVSVSNDNEDGSVTCTKTITVTNGNASPITIGEIGLVGSLTTGSSNYSVILIDRTPLESPVTIPAGGIGVITYSITV